MDATTQDRSNRLSVTRAGGGLITDYWERLFTAREQGKQIVWYNGGALNPFFQQPGLAWCHGEAFAARLAAQRLEGPAQLAGAEYGYNAELCSYARTHLGCSVLTLQSMQGERSGVVGLNDSQELERPARREPGPGDEDMSVPLFPGPSASDRSCTECDGTVASTGASTMVKLGPTITTEPS